MSCYQQRWDSSPKNARTAAYLGYVVLCQLVKLKYTVTRYYFVCKYFVLEFFV